MSTLSWRNSSTGNSRFVISDSGGNVVPCGISRRHIGVTSYRSLIASGLSCRLIQKKVRNMKLTPRALAVVAALTLSFAAVAANNNSNYRDTIELFKHAGQSASFFDKSYAYAVFPTIGEGAIGIGGAHGKGHVYVHGKWVGDVTMNQVTVGFQLGGKAFSQIVFFEDKRSLDEFEAGSYEFGADASAVAITAGADATAGTNGTETGASGGMKDATTRGHYQKGVAVFTIAKGGLMGQLSVGGQKFTYKARGTT